MIDREKLIKGLECHAHIAHQCKSCPYDEQRKRHNAGMGGPCDSFLAEDALSLLEDAAWVIANYVSILQDITGNCMSKPNYEVPAVLDCVRQHYCDGCDEKEEPRLMTVCEVTVCKEGTVLWVEERQGVTWNLFPLEIDVSSTHPDTGMDYLFFITYHDIHKFECSEYNRTWRCWTSRPTDEQMEAEPWEGDNGDD